MKYEIEIKQKVEVYYLYCDIQPRYLEDSGVNGVNDEEGKLMPCMNDGIWTPNIELKTGRIVNWEKGKKANIHYKVCDQGNYFLTDKHGHDVVSLKNGYVPNMLSPKENGCGDYVIMDVDEDGMIQDWKVDLNEFEEKE